MTTTNTTTNTTTKTSNTERTLSQWLPLAKCAGANPHDYSFETSKGRDLQAEAAALCAGCPVLVDCARDALAPLAVGTVRAGIWIPANTTMFGSRARRLARARLNEVVANA